MRQGGGGGASRVFSCKDAAQHVLMSSVCLCMCPSVCLSESQVEILSQYAIWKVPDCSRLFQPALECSGLFQNTCSFMEDFRKTSGRLHEYFRKTSASLWEAFRRISSKAYMKILELAFSFMSMHAVSCMQLSSQA